jgi:acetolactate synthase-1/2/3 large subunit
VVLPRHRNWNGKINPYHFLEVLFQRLADDDIVVVGNGAATVMTFQAASLKRGQRLFGNSGSASMGFDLPAAIGAAFADVGRRVICLAGDGSFMLNLQELQTVAHHKLPLKIFILNNDGYLSIRTSQSNFFGRMVGESPKSGVSFPDMVKLAQAFDVPGLRIDQPNFTAAIDQGLNHPGPILCDVILDPQQTFEPKLSSKQLADGRMVSAPLEDMFPFLDREELLQNLLVSPIN